MKKNRLLLGTEDGVALLHRDGDRWSVEADGLRGQKVWAVAIHPRSTNTYFAGTYGDGLFVSIDGGQSWQRSDDGLHYRYIRAIVFDSREPRTMYVGTEPAALFRSDDGGRTWRELEAIQNLPGANRWSLPYSPRRGALRTVVVVPDAPNTVYGGVEQGGIVLSRDRGETWELLGGGVHPDVHQLALSPADPSLLFAATGGGLYRSRDGGRSWTRLHADYIRSVWLDPRVPSHVWAGPGETVGRQGTILLSTNSGDTWQPASDGLVTPMLHMVEIFAGPLNGQLVAVTSGGGLLCADRRNPVWAEPFPLQDVHVMTATVA